MSADGSLAFRDSPVPYPGNNVWRAAVNRWKDGDTPVVERDTGCVEDQRITIRLTGVGWKGFDADERFTAGGKIITAEVNRLAPQRAVVVIETAVDPDDKYGRWLSPILIPLISLPTDATTEPENFVQRTIDNRPFFLLDLAAYLVWKYPEYCRWKSY
jgi:hypothetical protein